MRISAIEFEFNARTLARSVLLGKGDADDTLVLALEIIECDVAYAETPLSSLSLEKDVKGIVEEMMGVAERHGLLESTKKKK